MGVASSSLFANEAVDTTKLQSLLKGMSSMTAKFVQHSTDGRGGVLPTQVGELSAKSPGKFRWETKGDYPQLLVTNGKTLWLYDPDMENVTVQPLDKRVEMTPALMLSGEIDEINNSYEVLGEDLDGEMHFVLMPKTVDALFDRLELQFLASGKLANMVIKDELGQKTTIKFTDVATGVALDDSLFNFVPPEGVDVIHSGQ